MSVGIARRLSKLGLCSRTEATRWVLAGRVRVNGRLTRDPESATEEHSRIEVDRAVISRAEPIYLMLNKPRGLVTTASDERGRGTVYDCLADAGLPWVAPVGRLDKASEGLLLMSNDPQWAARITDPVHAVLKRYHVQVDRLVDESLLDALIVGVSDRGELLRATGASILRHGQINSWLEIVLDEGRNRQIRRLLDACGMRTLRLVRLGVGGLVLGDLAKGQLRRLTNAEVAGFH